MNIMTTNIEFIVEQDDEQIVEHNISICFTEIREESIYIHKLNQIIKYLKEKHGYVTLSLLINMVHSIC